MPPVSLPGLRPTLRTLLRLFTIAAVSATIAACSDDDDVAAADPGPPPAEQVPETPPAAPTPDSLRLSLLGRYSTGQFDESAAEIPSYDPGTKRGFIVNALSGTLDVLDLSNPAAPQKVGEIDAADVAPGAVVNSVTVRNGIIALAIEASDKTDPGFVGFYDAATLALLGHVGVGSLPDMLTFTPDGKYVLVANEGEPSDDYSVDPVGSISIIDATDPAAPTVRTAGFAAWNGKEAELRAAGVRIYGPGDGKLVNGATAAQDLEPEYIAVSPDSTTAWATLQENNAIAKIDIASATITDIVPLGFKDHGVAGNEFDASDDPAELKIATHPGVKGMYLPDAISAFEAQGKTWIATANEGDARAWGEDNDAYWGDGSTDPATPGDPAQGFVEEFRVKHLVHASGFARRRGDDLPPQLDQLAEGALLNPETFAWCGATAGDPGDCRDDEVLGRLNITWTLGYRTDANGDPVKFDATGTESPTGTLLMYDNLYAYGGRSFSILDADGKMVWDSGSAFETYLASDQCRLGPNRDIPCADYFNSGHDEGNAFDSRSDSKGPEPEAIEIGKLGDKVYAFIGLERMGGIMVYDVTTPEAPKFVDYYNSRANWTDDPEGILDTVGDLGPEGIKFVSPENSPTQDALLIVGNEVSGTTAIYKIEQIFNP
ncbi:choice-of-anchor I family protein [Bordetella sp. 2513F-2]